MAKYVFMNSIVGVGVGLKHKPKNQGP